MARPAPIYCAGIQHTEQSIEQMFRTRRYTYETMRMLARMGIGFILILLAVTAGLPMWARGLLMLAGTWLIVSRDFPSSTRADRVIDARKGVLPRMEYEFYDDRFHLSGEGSMDIAYGKLDRLVQDREYWYLFLARDSVCMVDRTTLEPREEEAFMAFLERKTGKTWNARKSVLAMNLQDLLQAARDRKTQRSGPRLPRRP